MKKLKKFFNLLPVVAIAFISGLAGLLSNDQTINETKADTLSVVSSFSLSDESYSYSSISTFGSCISTFHRTFNCTLYKELNNGSYIFSVQTAYLSTTNIYYPMNFLGTITGTSYIPGSNDTYYYNFAFNNLADNGFSTNSRQLSLELVSLDVQSSSSGDGTFIPSSSYFYIFTEILRLTIDGFGSVDLLFTTNLGGVTLEYLNGSGYLNSNSLAYSSTPISIFTHVVDISQSSYQDGYQDGYSVGYQDGYNNGYADGNVAGYNNGYDVGFKDGRDSREQDITNAYNDGYQAGYAQGFSVDTTVASIFSGVLQVGMLPVNVFLAIFNFEILGINLSAFIGALLTVCLTVIVIRTIKGGGSSD